MTRFHPVWFSTDAQVAALTAAYRDASWSTKLLGTFDLPEGVAHLRGRLMPWMRMPLVCVAEGTLEVSDRAVAFSLTEMRLFGWALHGLRTDVAFQLPVSAIAAVEPADVSSPVVRFFNIPFTRLRTTRPPPLDNFLLCVGGRIAMPRIRERSIELRRTLGSLIRPSAVS